MLSKVTIRPINSSAAVHRDHGVAGSAVVEVSVVDAVDAEGGEVVGGAAELIARLCAKSSGELEKPRHE